MNDIAGLAAGVLAPDAFLFVIVHVGEVNGRIRCSVRSARRHPNDTYGVGWCYLGGCGKERRDELGEKEVTKVVDAKLQLVALDSLRALRWNHDAGVIPEDIEACLLGEKLLSRCLDRGQVVELEFQEVHLAAR